MKQNLFYFLSLTCVFKEIYSACKTTYLTKCDRFSDLDSKIPYSENWVELQIGDELSTEKKESVNLMLYNFDDLAQIGSMKIISRIDNLERVPRCNRAYDIKLQYLTFYGNEITTVKPFSIPKFQLKLLQMTNNKIESIQKYALRWHYIEVLDLSNNALEGVEENSLPGTDATKIIYLKNNKIAFIDAKSFGSGLEVLDLSQNKLRSLTNEILGNLTKLKALILRENKFVSIPPIETLTSIKLFDFSYNQIDKIEDNQFGMFKALEVLDLSFNKLWEAPFLFQLLKQENKITISLEFNSMTRLSTDSLSVKDPPSKKLLLYGNPWNCVNWTTTEGAIKPLLEKCDDERFNDGKHPFCIELDRSDMLFGYATLVSQFQEVLKDSGKYRGCDLSFEKAKSLYPSTIHCDL